MRIVLIALMFLTIMGCQSPQERAASVQILPETGPVPPYPELLSRARNQATFATEAFFVNNWKELEEAAKSLEQTSRLMVKSPEIPDSLKAMMQEVSSDLNQEAVKLKEAASTKNEAASTQCLQKIHLKIRELRIAPGV